MALRWRKNRRPTGLAGVACGPMGSTLRLDGEREVAFVYSLGGRYDRWYWVARGDALGIDLMNTCHNPVVTEAEAKAAATAYVRECLAMAKDAL